MKKISIIACLLVIAISGCKQGSSFREALFDRDMDWEDVAFSQYPRSVQINGQPAELMGYSMRTAEYRYTKWIDLETGKTFDTELYGHSDSVPEMINLAADDEFEDLVNMLDDKLEVHYTKEHGRSLQLSMPY